MNVSTTPMPAETSSAAVAATSAEAEPSSASVAHVQGDVVEGDVAAVTAPAEQAVAPSVPPRDTLSDDVRSSLLLIAATAAFALAVVALGALAAGVPV